jgi:hypothetical protein
VGIDDFTRKVALYRRACIGHNVGGLDQLLFFRFPQFDFLRRGVVDQTTDGGRQLFPHLCFDAGIADGT